MYSSANNSGMVSEVGKNNINDGVEYFLLTVLFLPSTVGGVGCLGLIKNWKWSSKLSIA